MPEMIKNKSVPRTPIFLSSPHPTPYPYTPFKAGYSIYTVLTTSGVLSGWVKGLQIAIALTLIVTLLILLDKISQRRQGLIEQCPQESLQELNFPKRF
jgi:hypothetical protein